MTEEQLVRLEAALDKFESYLIRVEKIDKLKTSNKRVHNWDMDAINKAFDEGMKKALNNLNISDTTTC